MRTFVFAIALTAIAVPAFSADLNGVVVDQSGAPIPRALVRLVDSAGTRVLPERLTFSDARGRFELTAAPAACRIEVSLTGFAPGVADCAATPLRIVLHVAPVQEDVVVTATRTAAPSDQVGASVTTFTADDIASRDTPLVSELLRSAPGAMIVQSGGPGSVASLFVRGGESNYNKVLLDGIPLNEPGGTFNFSNVTTNDLERVEVVRGAQSALFGSDAMSSVVQLFTKRASRRDRPEVSLSVEGGTYATMRAGAAVSGASGAVDYSAGVARYDTDNREPNNAFDNTTISANVGVALGSAGILRAIGRGELGRTGTPGQTAFGRPDMDAFFTRHDGMAGVAFEQQATATLHQRAAYSLAASNQRSADLIEDPPYTPRLVDPALCPPPSYVCEAPFPFSDFLYDTRTELRRHHASYQADWHATRDPHRAGDHQLSVVGDWDGERATLVDAMAGTLTPASRNNMGVSIQDQALWTRVFVTGGLRFEHNASFGGAVVPRGSLAWVAHESSGGAFGSTTLRASGGLGIKEPTLLQSFSPSPYYHGNPDLEAERSRTFEAGVDQRFARDRARVDVAWFDNSYQNLIALRTTDPATFASEYFNIGRSTARGLEISGEIAPSTALRARAGYSFLGSEIVESASDPLFADLIYAVGEPLLRRPRHSGFVGVAATWSRVTAGLDGVLVGAFADSDFSSLSPEILVNPGWTAWNARASVKVTRQFTATLALDNIGDHQYMEPLGYRALGRAVRVGVRAGF